MEILIKNQKISLQYSDTAGVWMTNANIGSFSNLSIEISKDDFRDKFIDWNLFTDFMSFVDTEILPMLNLKSKKLLLNYIDTIGFYSDTNSIRFKLEGVFYKSKIHSRFFEGEVFSYSLLFKLYKSGYEECYEPYVNYLIFVENGLITGFKKEQL